MQCHDFVAEYDWEKYRRGWWNGGPFPATLNDVLTFCKDSDKIRVKCMESKHPITFIQCSCGCQPSDPHMMYFYSKIYQIPKSWQPLKMNSHPDLILHWFQVDNNFQSLYKEYYKHVSLAFSGHGNYFFHSLLTIVLEYILCSLDVKVTCYNLNV